jgi:hypothetical protein
VTDFLAEATLAKTETSFDWSRKVDSSLGAGVDGTTYLAFIATDYLSNKAHLIAKGPDHQGHNFTAWKAECMDTTMNLRISGSVIFTADGLQKAQVETAAKAALAATLDVNADLIQLNVTMARRLKEDSSRRLANSWKVDYAVEVPKAKGTAVEQAAFGIQNNPTAFQGALETALNELPEASAWAQKKTVSVTSVSKPETEETAAKDQNVGAVDGATSLWLSSGVALLVALIASM